MKREDFIAVIGFQGNAAIVDKRLRRRFGSATTAQLFEEGLHKAAFCSALYSEDPAEMQLFIRSFSQRLATGSDDAPEITEDGLKRVFGVHGVPDGIAKILYV